jgi:hypothetical protein
VGGGKGKIVKMSKEYFYSHYLILGTEWAVEG